MSSTDQNGVAEIMRKMSELHITELHIRKDDSSFSLSTGPSSISSDKTSVSSVSDEQNNKKTQEVTSAGEKPDDSAETNVDEEMPAMTINSPLVGKFYSTPAPGKPPFVKVGDTVKADDTVCIVEGMKLINEIKAETDCRIVKILVENGESVDNDQPLIGIETLPG